MIPDENRESRIENREPPAPLLPHYPMLTEAINPATTAIDSLSTRAIVAAIVAEDAKIVPAVSAVGDEIVQQVDVDVERMRLGGSLITIVVGISVWRRYLVAPE